MHIFIRNSDSEQPESKSASAVTISINNLLSGIVQSHTYIYIYIALSLYDAASYATQSENMKHDSSVRCTPFYPPVIFSNAFVFGQRPVGIGSFGQTLKVTIEHTLTLL